MLTHQPTLMPEMQVRPPAPSHENTREIRLLVAVREWNDVERLNLLFGPQNAYGIRTITWCQDGARLYRDAVDLDADVVLLDPALPAFALEDIQRLYHHEARPIVTVGAIPAHGDWGSALYRAGIKAHVELPLHEENTRRLVALIHNALQEALRERSSPSYIPQLAPQLAQVIATQAWQRAVIAVWSAKGGVGKTTVAENLAMLLGVVSNRKTILLDANMAGGNAHIHLRLAPQRNIAGLAHLFQAQGSLDPKTVLGYLTPFRQNLSVLVGIPRQFLSGESCFQGAQGGQFISTLIQTLHSMSDFVVMDLGQDANNAVHLQALLQADQILVVVNSEKASLLDTHEVLETLWQHAHIDRARCRLVLNRFHPEHGLHRKEIVDVMKLPEVGVIPEAYEKVTASLNSGVPLVLNGGGEVAESLMRVGTTLYPPLAQIWGQRGKFKTNGSGFTKRWFGGKRG